MRGEPLTADCKPHAEPGARIKGQVSPATFSACSEVIRRQPLLRLHGAKIRQVHAGNDPGAAGDSGTRSSWAASLSPPGNASWLPPS